MKPYILAASLFALGLGNNIEAQQLKMELSPKPTLHQVDLKKYAEESAVIILDETQIVLEVDKNLGAVEHNKYHKIVKLLNEKGIENYNKIKIPFSDDYPIISIHARSISPSGKVHDIPKSAIKIEKSEDGFSHKLFAFEGVEKGSEIEYLIETRERFSESATVFFQENEPVIHSALELLSPNFIIFSVKGYNGVKISNLLQNEATKLNTIIASVDSLNSIEDEKYAAYKPHLARVEYFVGYNVYNGSKEKAMSWDRLAKSDFKDNYTFTEKEKKAVKPILENKDYKKITSTKQKVEWIENYLKKEIQIKDHLNHNNHNDVDVMLKTKLATEYSISRLFIVFFQLENIAFQKGFSLSRFTKTFDYSFSNYSNLKNTIFYFPETKTYLEPDNMLLRMPFISSGLLGNEAMFVKIVSMDNISTATHEKRLIDILPQELSAYNHHETISFSQNLDTTHIQLALHLKGFHMQSVLPYLVFSDEDKHNEIVEKVLQLTDNKEDITNIKIENKEFKNYNENKALILSGQYHSPNFVEKAGNKYLFKIGELLGPQSELYNEKKRQFDIEINYPNHNDRHFVVTIPKGYNIKNLEKLNNNVVCKNGDQLVADFSSKYTLNNNVLDLVISEHYYVTKAPISLYENFKKVVNAAADFNKIVLILEK